MATSPDNSTSGSGTEDGAASVSGGTSGDSTAPVIFAVIGDYGDDSDGEGQVAAMVASWNPDFIVTLGDNNYPDGEASTIDENVGQYYADYIGHYVGDYGQGSRENRFWPCPGNHDWREPDLGPYLDYFTLPGNERYYEVEFGPVHLFTVDSDSAEPDGATLSSVQGQWLQSALATSQACHRLVVFHHAAYSSSAQHGSTERMQWPFADWGATAVMGGHDHIYERLEVDGIPYFVNGLGGAEVYEAGTPLPESVVQYADDFGAMLVTADASSVNYRFYAVDGTLVDDHTVEGCSNP